MLNREPMTADEVAEALTMLQFRREETRRTVGIDGAIRDYLVTALRQRIRASR